jgi:NAD(P)-dependent dehydrogenase (short-subunit alcohol dehydrogenase family)
MSPLDKRVVIVTGALGGSADRRIGGATARLLVDAGARVVLTDVVGEGGAEFAEELAAQAGEASFTPRRPD